VIEETILKTNILSIIASGLVMALMGAVLYYFREAAAPHMRYLLTIPPVGVAAYIYVFNMYRKFNGKLPQPHANLLFDLFTATLTVAGVFLVFSALLMIIISFFNQS